MPTLDFTPLFRSSIGFDRVPEMLSDAMQRAETGYPPYNIEKCGANEYLIVLAVAGFTKDDIEIVSERNLLTVRGRLTDKNDHEYLYRGIAARSFERVFNLADYIGVGGAMIRDGLLIIDLKRQLPEALKPRRIEIAGAPAKPIKMPSQQAA